MAKSTKGVQICLTKSGSTGTDITPTAASKAAPAEITTTATGATKNGDLIYVPKGTTGLSEIDGMWWVVDGLVKDTSLQLLGSDTTASTGTFATTAAIKAYAEIDLECLCLSEITFNRDEPETISAATFCDTTASIPGNSASAGSISFSGFVDVTATDYKELLRLEKSGAEAGFKITLPDNGFVVFPATINQISMAIPLEGAVSYSGSATLKSAQRHLFA